VIVEEEIWLQKQKSARTTDALRHDSPACAGLFPRAFNKSRPPPGARSVSDLN
jgi:hypothetical protein